jgi:integrase
MGMLAQPWKHPKTGVYYCRIVVPKDIREAYGKTEIRKSLGTKSAAEARRLFPHISDGYRFEFEELRRKAELADNLKVQAEAKPDVLNRRDVSILVSRFYNNELLKVQHSKENALSLITKYDLIAVRLSQWNDNKAEATDESAVDGLPLDYEQECFELFADDAEDLLTKAGYLIPRSQASFKAVVTGMANVIPKLRDAVTCTVFWTGTDPQPEPIANAETSPPLQRDNPEPSKPLLEKLKTESITAVFERYKETQLRAAIGNEKSVERTLNDYSSVIKRFDEFSNGKSVSQITKTDIGHFRDLLLRLPSRPRREITSKSLEDQIKIAASENLPLLSPNTARKQMMALSSVLEYAFEVGLSDSNPARGATRRLTQSIERVSGEFKQYSQSDLVKIFSSPIFTQGFRPSNGAYGEAVYWLPLLAYYTGARVEELAQLYVSDVKQEKGIHYLHITADKADKSVKNKGSVRKVPLHKHLVALGFIDYVSQQPADGRVFSKLTKGSDGRYANKISTWLSYQWRNKLDIRQDIKPMHGFRHTWKTLARDVGIPKEVSDAITGHSSGDVSDTYGQYSLELLSRQIDLIPEAPLALSMS